MIIISKKFFSFLFIISIFLGVFHELDAHHEHGETCEVCVVAHTSAILNDDQPLTVIQIPEELFYTIFTSIQKRENISLRSRSPPLSSYYL